MVALFFAAPRSRLLREEISSKCTIPAHDKAVRGIGVPDNPPLLLLHITQPNAGSKVTFYVYFKQIWYILYVRNL